MIEFAIPVRTQSGCLVADWDGKELEKPFGGSSTDIGDQRWTWNDSALATVKATSDIGAGVYRAKGRQQTIRGPFARYKRETG
jgi:hypothetical protein